MAILDASQSIRNAIQWLETALQQLTSEQTQSTSSEAENANHQEPQSRTDAKIAWGSKVSPEFKKRVLWIADQLGCDPSWLMACMAWESGRTFSPSVTNMAGSGATGLIQFMPQVAVRLGTTTKALAALSAEDQLKFVYLYFQPFAGKLHNLGDCYMAILWPAAVGKSDDDVIFNRNKGPTAYRQNAGLDINHDGSVTRGECLNKIKGMLDLGLSQFNIG